MVRKTIDAWWSGLNRGQNRCYWDMHGGVTLIERWRRSE